MLLCIKCGIPYIVRGRTWQHGLCSKCAGKDKRKKHKPQTIETCTALVLYNGGT